jgi:hypothetical protein
VSKGRTLKIQAVQNGMAMLTEHPPGAEATTYFVPADWLARDQVPGTLVRATEEMPGVVRFRQIANPNWLEDPAEDVTPKVAPALDEEPTEVPGDTLDTTEPTDG